MEYEVMTDYERMKYLFHKSGAVYVEGKRLDDPIIIIPGCEEALVFYFDEDKSIIYCAASNDDWKDILKEAENNPDYIVHERPFLI